LSLEPAAEPVTQVFPEAGRKRFFHGELVVAAPVGLTFGPQEQGGAGLLAVEMLSEAEPVGDEEHLDARVQQGADDLKTPPLACPAFRPLRRLAGAISHTGNFGELHRRAPHCTRPTNWE
jgi:hypothetical protein